MKGLIWISRQSIQLSAVEWWFGKLYGWFNILSNVSHSRLNSGARSLSMLGLILPSSSGP